MGNEAKLGESIWLGKTLFGKIHLWGSTREHFPCEKCDYRSTSKQSLRRHKQFKHDGLGYACEDCDYESVSKQQLNLHMVSKHDGEKISCDKCDY